MRALRFLPFTFLAGIDGFGMFAPYLAVVLAVVPLIRLAQEIRLARLADAAAADPTAGAYDLPDQATLSI